jgi:GNAT superfamily N-acetyltransferase
MSTAPPSAPLFDTEAIRDTDAQSGFHSGKHSLDDYLARHAFANHQRGIGATHVLRRRTDDPAGWPDLLGYYTLSMGAVTSEQAAGALQERFPRYPIPVALIGRLAVDQRARGAGIGALLLGDAVRRVLAVADHIGCIGIIVDALDTDAESFYAHFGFAVLEPTPYPRRMFLPIETARASLA